VAEFEFALQANSCPASDERGGGDDRVGHLSLCINIGVSYTIMIYYKENKTKFFE
jgi:hypothetical protein